MRLLNPHDTHQIALKQQAPSVYPSSSHFRTTNAFCRSENKRQFQITFTQSETANTETEQSECQFSSSVGTELLCVIVSPLRTKSVACSNSLISLSLSLSLSLYIYIYIYIYIYTHTRTHTHISDPSLRLIS
jgi:hypothetical protein